MRVFHATLRNLYRVAEVSVRDRALARYGKEKTDPDYPGALTIEAVRVRR